MKLYLQAVSKNGIAYTPDWIKFQNSNHEITFDIIGCTDFLQEADGFCTRTKGYFEAWLIDDDEINRQELDEDQQNALTNKWLKVIYKQRSTYQVTVALHDEESFMPDSFTNYEEKVKTDAISNGEGTLYFNIDGQEYEMNFKFDNEDNGY